MRNRDPYRSGGCIFNFEVLQITPMAFSKPPHSVVCESQHIGCDPDDVTSGGFSKL